MALPPDILAGVARRLAESAGLQLPSWVVEARTAARIAALATTPQAYVELIASGRGQAELGVLIESVRVGESSLFRHKPQIATLLDVVVPVLRARGKRTIRVWSAGCASGEEPYTLATVLSRALVDCTVAVHATDVSAEALELAERGDYPHEALDDVPAEWRDAFVERGDRIAIDPRIRRLVTFERANLVDAAPPKGCDVVWCRNVLIYFSPQARRRAIDRLISATVPGGFVFVGYSESLRDVEQLEAQRAGDVVFYMRPVDDARTPVPVRTRTDPAIVVPTRTKTDPAIPVTPRPSRPIPDHDVLALTGTPDAQAVTQQIGERLAIGGLRRLVIDLDGADLLADELAPVLRRACAAGRAANIAVALRTTRPGARRWLSRHALPEEPS